MVMFFLATSQYGKGKVLKDFFQSPGSNYQTMINKGYIRSYVHTTPIPISSEYTTVKKRTNYVLNS